MDVALIIPCFNEEKRLSTTFRRIDEYFDNDPLPGKRVVVVFVDDASTDGTNRLLTEYAGRPHARFGTRVVRLVTNEGKGGAVKAGFASIEANAYGFTDADLSYGLEPVAPFVEGLKDADVVIASREAKAEDYSPLRRMISKTLLALSRWMTGVKATDPQSGFKFFRPEVVRAVFPKITQTRFSFDVECLTLCEAAGYSIKEIPLRFTHDGGSSVATSDGVRYLLDLLSIWDRLPSPPVRFYLQLFALASVISIAVYGWMVAYGYFFSDDFTWLWFGQRVLAEPMNILTLKAGTFFSPVLNIYYAVMRVIFGTSARWYFSVNILIHVLATVAGGILVFDLMRSRIAATLTVVLLALSGGAYEPIVWIGANMHSIVTLFILIALVGFERFLRGRGMAWAMVSILSSIIAFCTKESSIILPFLFVGLWLTLRARGEVTLSKAKIWAFAAVGLLLTVLYAIGQVILQEGGATFAKNSYTIDWQGIAKIPFAIFDLFVPWKGIFDYVTDWSAALIAAVLVIVLFAVLWRFRTFPLVPFAFLFMLLGVGPTLFFATTTWWEPLASRYTYLPHVGAVIAIAAIITTLIRQNQARRIIHGFAAVLLFVAAVQIWYMAHMISTNYSYVYRTGRTLAHAAELLNSPRTEGVFVHADHPFRGNNAHIVAALAVYANISESAITFLSPDQIVHLDPAHMLLYWRPYSRQYELTSHDEIFKQFPLQ